MKVHSLSVIFIVLDMFLAVAVPAAAFIFIRKKFSADRKPFFAGCAVMLLFALVLEQMLHGLVLSTPAGPVIQGNIWLYALYGGFAAGLFEECGRYIAMKTVLKENFGNPGNALMYGAGHGGFEMFILLGFGMINNLVYSLMLNLGQADALMAPLDPANQAVLQSAFETLAGTSPFLFLMSPVERLSALCAQLSLSVIVWYAASWRGRGKWLFLAIGLHMLLDAVSVIVNSLAGSVLLTELVVCAMAVCFALLAKRFWQKLKLR